MIKVSINLLPRHLIKRGYQTFDNVLFYLDRDQGETDVYINLLDKTCESYGMDHEVEQLIKMGWLYEVEPILIKEPTAVKITDVSGEAYIKGFKNGYNEALLKNGISLKYKYLKEWIASVRDDIKKRSDPIYNVVHFRLGTEHTLAQLEDMMLSMEVIGGIK